MSTVCFPMGSNLLPTGHPSWEPPRPGPPHRGTFAIISLCLSTTIICVWSSFHRDIPLTRLSVFRSRLRDARLVLVALFFPELLLFFAINQFFCARRVVKTASELKTFRVLSDGEKPLKSWTRKRLFDFLKTRWRPSPGNDDGSESQHDESEEIAMDNRETGDPQYGDRQHAFTLVHGFYATMGGFAFRALADDGTLSQRRAKFTAKGVRFLMKHEPNLIPDLSLTSITDRSDSGSLGNALLFIQATWFCLNCISRIRGRLPLAHLEVWTMAHGLCTLASYTAWWSKPRNIDAPTWISMDDEYAREAVALMQLLRLEGQTDHKRFQSAVENNYVLPQDFDTQILPLALRAAARYKLSPKDLQRKDDDPDYHITFDSTPRFEQLFWHVGLGRCLAGYGIVTCIPIFYGMSYLLGEDLAFPSIAEGRLWHKVTVGIMSSGAAVVTLFVARDVGCKMCSTVGQRKVITGYYDTVLYNLIPFFYVLGSIYLLTECIEQLRYMVSFAYVVTSWAYYFPHFY